MTKTPGPFDEQAALLEQLNSSVLQARETVEAGRLAVEQRIEAAAAEEEERRKTERAVTRRKNRNTLIIAGLISTLGFLFGIYNKISADNAIDKVEEALIQFEADRIDRSINACEDRNDIRIKINQLALSAAGHDETGNPTAAFQAATPEQQARAQATVLSRLIPLQICTVGAIDQFIASGRTEGLVPIDGSDGSYSEAVTPPAG